MMYRVFAILFICLSSFGATQKIVQTDLNNIVQQPTNFWNSQPSDVLFSNAVNAVAGSGVSTNGLATTNFVISYAYPTSNPSLFVTASVTNGLVGAGITNGLATTNFVNNAIVGFVTASITNGLATTNYATTQAQNFAQQATNGLVIPSTNGFVTSSITNGLATTNYVNNATNGLLSTIPVGATNQFTATNDTVWFISQANQVALTNGYLRTIPAGATNQFVATNDTTWFDVAANRFALTNKLTFTNDTTWFIAQAGQVALTNGYLRTIPTGATNQFLVTIPVAATNKFTVTNDTTWFMPKKAVVTWTNANNTQLTNSTVVSDTTNAITFSVAGTYIFHWEMYARSTNAALIVVWQSTNATAVGWTSWMCVVSSLSRNAGFTANPETAGYDLPINNANNGLGSGVVLYNRAPNGNSSVVNGKTDGLICITNAPTTLYLNGNSTGTNLMYRGSYFIATQQ